MRHGQHRLLLTELLHHIRHDYPDLRDTADRATICSRRPGTAGYDNMCEFPGDSYVAVRRTLEREDWQMQLEWGQRTQSQERSPMTLARSPTDAEVRDYAREVYPWLAQRLRTADGHDDD